MKHDFIINKYGTKIYYVNGLLHREDGPAIEYTSGTKVWHINGKLHRDNSPAIEWANGNKEWFKNPKRHREDGPAIEHDNGSKKWWLNDILYGLNNHFTNESWKEFVKTLITN